MRRGVGIGCAAAASVVLSLLLCFPAAVPSSILPWTPARGCRGRERGRRREVRRGRRGARDRRVGSWVRVDGRGERIRWGERTCGYVVRGGRLLFYATASAPRCRALQSPRDAHLLFFPHARRDGGSTGNNLRVVGLCEHKINVHSNWSKPDRVSNFGLPIIVSSGTVD